jgi:hypothetical protein
MDQSRADGGLRGGIAREDFILGNLRGVALAIFQRFCRARGMSPLFATVGLLRAFFAHCICDLKHQPTTVGPS